MLLRRSRDRSTNGRVRAAAAKHGRSCRYLVVGAGRLPGGDVRRQPAGAGGRQPRRTGQVPGGARRLALRLQAHSHQHHHQVDDVWLRLLVEYFGRRLQADVSRARQLGGGTAGPDDEWIMGGREQEAGAQANTICGSGRASRLR